MTMIARWNFHSSTCDYGLGYPCRCGGAEQERTAQEVRRLVKSALQLLLEADVQAIAHAGAVLVEALYLLDTALGIPDEAGAVPTGEQNR